ncbi:MAG: ABC transporter ATP-binding protein [Myxococcales bacterium]
MSVLRRIGRYLAAERGALLAAAACMVLLAATTAAYAWLIGPVVKFLVTGGAQGLSRAFALVPSLASLDRAQALLALPVAVLIVAALKGLAYFGQFYLMGMVGQRVIAAVRRDYLGSLLRQDAAYFAQARTGDLLSRFSADMAHVERAVTYSTAAYLRDSLSVVSLAVLAFVLDWRLSLVAFVGVPVLAVPVARLAKKLKRRARQSQESQGRLSAIVQEGLWGLRVLQAYRLEERELARFDRENAQVLRAETKAAKARSLGPAVVELVSVAGLAMVLYLAAESVTRGAVDSERLVSFLATVAFLFQPARALGRVGQFVVQAIASGERIFEVVDRVPAVRSPAQAAPLPAMEKALALERVSFAYQPERSVLDGLELKVGSGEIVALVGESGSGKSTAALLAMRFADPAAGKVTVDGADVRQAELASVRRQAGLVTQEPLLFSGSVHDNIAYGSEGGATRAEVEWAARVADAHDFVSALPQGYDTPIGERGVKLSGGQKQRVALARALLARAPVLLLDEATSNLDAQSEREVTRALGQALQDRTALVIAHRLSTVAGAHRIAVLKGGQIVEQGTHAELLERGGEYARLHRLQTGGAEEARHTR